MITGIAGMNSPPKDPVTKKQTWFVRKVQPFKSWTYLDLKDKKQKWGDELPLARTMHCVVKYNESTAFIFGGGDIGGRNGEGYIQTTYNMWKAYVKELRSGFFMRIPDPNRPNKFIVTEMPDNGNFPCKENNNRVPTTCGLRTNKENGPKELVVPTYELEEKRPCTAILDMASFTWRKLEKDARKHINESLIAYVYSDDFQEHVYFMGGYYAFDPMNRTLRGTKPVFKHVYRYNYELIFPCDFESSPIGFTGLTEMRDGPNSIQRSI